MQVREQQSVESSANHYMWNKLAAFDIKFVAEPKQKPWVGGFDEFAVSAADWAVVGMFGAVLLSAVTTRTKQAAGGCRWPVAELT